MRLDGCAGGGRPARAAVTAAAVWRLVRDDRLTEGTPARRGAADHPRRLPPWRRAPACLEEVGGTRHRGRVATPSCRAVAADQPAAAAGGADGNRRLRAARAERCCFGRGDGGRWARASLPGALGQDRRCRGAAAARGDARREGTRRCLRLPSRRAAWTWGRGGGPAARTRRPSPVGPPLPRAVRLDGRCAAAAARRDEGRRLGRRGPGRRRGGRPRHPPGEWGGASTAPRANRVHLQDAWWQLGGGGAGGGSGVPCPPLTTRTAPLPAPAVPIVHRRGNGDGGGGPSGGGRLQLAPPWVTVPYRRRTRGRGGR